MKPYYTPREVDGMCLWEIGIILGVDEQTGGPQMQGTESVHERMEREKHTLAERAARIREMNGEEPVEDEDITSQVMSEMGIRTR